MPGEPIQGASDKAGELHERRQYILYLERELRTARQDVVRLESELVTGANSIMHAAGGTGRAKEDSITSRIDSGSKQDHDADIPIHRLHDDLLYLLFKFCISLQHNEIGALVQVCQRWYTFIMNSPKLWARIQILEGHSLFDSPRRPSKLSYIMACMERSGELPLEVELRITGLPSCNAFIQWLMTEYATTVTDFDEHARLQSQITGQDWKYESEIYDKQLDRAIELLVGKDRAGARRWEKVNLELPNTKDVGIRVWRGLVGAYPNVKTFVSSSIPELSSLNGELRSARIDLPIIEHLKVHQELGSLPLTFDPTTIKVLRIDFEQNLENILRLSEFTELEDVWLTGVHTSPRIPDPFTIHLPKLRKLTLGGHYDWLRPLHFDLPSLEDLIVRNWYGVRPVPSLSPRRVIWCPLRWDPPTIVTALQTFSSLAGSVEVIQVAPSSMALNAQAYPKFDEKNGGRLEEITISKGAEELTVLNGREPKELLEAVEKVYYAEYRA